MPTATFEALGTVTITGSSTVIVQFTPVNDTTYKNFIVFGCVMMDSNSEQLCMRVGNSSPNTYKYQNAYAGNGSNGTGVPTTGINNDNQFALTQYNINTNTYPTVFKITYSTNGNTSTQFISEAGLWVNAAGVANFNITNGRFNEGLYNVIQLRGYSGGAFKAGSVFSLYGLI